MTTPATLTKQDAIAALKAAAWTSVPGLDEVALRLLDAVNAVRNLCHGEDGDRLDDDARLRAGDVSAALENALEGKPLPTPRTTVHCRIGGIGADWDLEAAVALVEAAQTVEWSRSLLGHDLLVVSADGEAYRLQVPMPGTR